MEARRTTPTGGNFGRMAMGGVLGFGCNGVARSSSPGRGERSEEQARDQALCSVLRQTERRTVALPQADRRRVRERRIVPGSPDRRRFPANQETLCGGRDHGLEHRQHQSCTTCRTSRSTSRAATRRSRSTSTTCATSAKAGISYTTYAHMGNGIWSSGHAVIRGAAGREFDLSSPTRKGCLGRQELDGAALPRPRVHE